MTRLRAALVEFPRGVGRIQADESNETTLAILAWARDVEALGRFDGVVVRQAHHDSYASVILSLSKGPGAPAASAYCCCEVVKRVVLSVAYQAFGHIETREAPRQCGA
jgi:hypothetical protein